MHQQTHREIREVLINHFNLGELRTLAFDLNVEFEDLQGNTRLHKAQSLIEYADRRGRLDDLIQYVMKLRPNIDLPKQTIPPKSSININIGNVCLGAAIGTGATIRAENIAGRDIIVSGQFLEKRDDFKEDLQKLQQRIKALLSKEQLPSKPSSIILENLEDIFEQASSPSPNARWIILRLEDTGRVLNEITSMSDISHPIFEELKRLLEIVEQLITLSEKAFSNSG